MSTDPVQQPVRLVIERVESEVDELVADRCWVNRVMGIEERDGVVLATFERLADAQAARAEIEALFAQRSIAADIVTEEVTDAGWLDAWRDHAQAYRVGGLLIRPPWLDPDPSGDPDNGSELEILIDPGHAFGSGSHESTRLSLRAIQHVAHSIPNAADRRTLDVGCGSGVLAIAAVRLGFDHALAIDIDPAAVTATTANAGRNDVASRIDVSTRALADVDGHFDLVVANVLAPILRELGPDLVRCLAPNGHLVVSGLLADQLTDVLGRLPGLAVQQQFDADGWVSVVLATA